MPRKKKEAKEKYVGPELRPEFVEKIKKTEHLKGIKFKSVKKLRKRYNNF